tara:strand:+ start:384 stop:689 length:306 start_codon:yes stop_codon:yes gene_type:complete
MAEWKKIGALENFKDDSKWEVIINKRRIALFLYKKKYYAIKNSCLHQGYPLTEGSCSDNMIECPLHGWVYDFTTGKCLSLNNRSTATFKVREKNNNLEIKI